MLNHFLAVSPAKEAEQRQEKSGSSTAATQPVTHHLAHLRYSWLPHPKSVHWLASHARAGRSHPVLHRCDAGRMDHETRATEAAAADDGSDQGLTLW